MALLGCRNIAPNYVAPTELNSSDLKVIQKVAKSTWDYLELSCGQSGIPADHMLIRENGDLTDSNYTTITNVGLYLMSVQGAVDLGYIDQATADQKIEHVLNVLENLKKSSHGLFYNYFIHKGNMRPADDLYVSSVDSAWLAAGLIVTSRNANPKLSKQAKAMAEAMDFSVFYDSKMGQFLLGYSDSKKEQSNYHYGQIVSEARVINYIAIAEGQVPESSWYHLNTTLPKEWDWQKQKPRGRNVTIDGHTFFQGYYMYDKIPIVPSWGGSMFEFLMPTLIVPEEQVAPRSLGINNVHAVQIQIDQCLKKDGYPVWGLSPSAIPAGIDNFKYGEFGVALMGSKGYKDEGIIAPYASALAVSIDTKAVVENFKKLMELYPKIWTTYGFYDSVNVKTKEVAPMYLTLDQAMIFVALQNYLTLGKTQQRFFQGHIKEKLLPLLGKETFY